MKRVIVLILILTLHFCSMAQNLVVNPSFEDTIACSIFQNNNYPQMPCTGWYWATGGSCDYLSEQYFCISSPAPANVFGFQYPKTGIAYCGFSVYNSYQYSPGYREYLGGQLIDTLKQGRTYCINFYIVKADSGRFFSSDIGVYLAQDSSVDYNTALDLPYTPQILNTNGIIYDTLNWTLISGLYTAGGGEKYFIIGNFNNDFNSTLDSVNQTTLPSNAFAYYYIDDVSVVDCTTGIEEIEKQQLQFTVAPNPVKDKLVLQLQNTKSNNNSVAIFNAMGSKVTEQTFNKNSLSIDVSRLNAGIYFVKVTDKNGLAAVKRFVKW